MFKNRSLQIKMVKDGDIESVDIQPIDIDHIIKRVTRSIILCTIVYVGADTLRRAAIYAWSAKI